MTNEEHVANDCPSATETITARVVSWSIVVGGSIVIAWCLVVAGRYVERLQAQKDAQVRAEQRLREKLARRHSHNGEQRAESQTQQGVQP